MNRVWVPVSPVQARAHPLYGRGGWLMLFVLSVAMILAISSGFWALMFSANAVADSMIRFLGVFAAVSAFAGLVILALYVVKSPNFRIAAISLMLVPWPVLAGIYYASVPQAVILAGSALWLLSVAIWVTYLQRSQRVRVTFEHCVAGEPTDGRTEPVYMAQRSTLNVPAIPRVAAGAMAQKFDVINSRRDRAHLSDADREEDFWAQALAEYEGDNKKPGLWARAYAETQGDEAAAKAHYLKLRATQLLDDYRELTQEFSKQQEAEQEAVELNDRYESSLTDHQRKIMGGIEQVEYGGEDAFNAAVHLINLLGGTVERKPSVIFSSSGWRAEIAGYHESFPDEKSLVQWVVSVILPRARMLLPPRHS
jgi:hypothetical protein